jgi:hypothetical protein
MSAAPYVEQPRAIKDGVTYPGALLYVYASGTLSPLVTIYADPELETPLENPLPADSAARWPAIYLDPDAHDEYRARCVSADGTDLVFDDDPVNPAAAPYSRPGPALDASARPLGGATLTFYAERTSQKAPIYADELLAEELPNPVSADANGEFPGIWTDGELSYRVLQHTASGILVYDIGFVRGIEVTGPAAPPVLSGVNVGDINQLTWTPASPGSFPISYYELERSEDGSEWTVIATVDASDPLQYDDSVDAGSDFFYRVQGFDSAGNPSGYSNTVEIESAEADPYWNDVVILLTADTGVLTEWSGLPEWQLIGDGALSTAQVKFGSNSLRNPGNGRLTNYVRFTDGVASPLLQFPGEYTFEAWFYVVAEHNAYMNFWSATMAGATLQMGIQTSSNRLIYDQGTGGADTLFPATPTYGAYFNQWTHLAVTRDASNVVRLFLGGVQIASATITGTVNTGLTEPRLGLAAANNVFDNSDLDCYVDQFRVTKRCRYTSDFSVPTAPFPKTGP